MIIIVVVYILVAAVRSNKLIAKASHSEVETTVKLWLQYVAEYDGGLDHMPGPGRLHCFKP